MEEQEQKLFFLCFTHRIFKVMLMLHLWPAGGFESHTSTLFSSIIISILYEVAR